MRHKQEHKSAEHGDAAEDIDGTTDQSKSKINNRLNRTFSLSFYHYLFCPPSPPLYAVYSLCYRLVISITAQINLPQNTGGGKEISCRGKIVITTFHIIILLISYSMFYNKNSLL